MESSGMSGSSGREHQILELRRQVASPEAQVELRGGDPLLVVGHGTALRLLGLPRRRVEYHISSCILSFPEQLDDVDEELLARDEWTGELRGNHRRQPPVAAPLPGWRDAAGHLAPRRSHLRIPLRRLLLRLGRQCRRNSYWLAFQMSVSSFQPPRIRRQRTTYLPSTCVICFCGLGASRLNWPISRAALPN